MQDEKYAVVKKETLDELLRAMAVEGLTAKVGEALKYFVGGILDDAVVIRTKDIFATSGLWAYAHTITTHLELMGPRIDYVEGQYLHAVRDYFAQRAAEAEAIMADDRAVVPD